MKKITMTLLLLFSFCITSVFAQTRVVSGKVTDSGTGLPILGATIIVQGTSNGSYSLDGGEFSITNVEGSVNLEVTFMGYTETIVPVSASQTSVDIKLTPSAMQMDEVVVIAYGTADKKSLTGSVAVISSEDMALRPLTNATSAIAGMSPGVTTTTASGIPGQSAGVRIRGIGSINSSAAPLYVVDGVPYPGDISSISPEDIQSMSILKDAASTALYGSRASNGVIMIQTKSGRSGKVSFEVSIKQGITFRAQEEYEKIDALDWYELSWELFRNSEVTQGLSVQEADILTSRKAFKDYEWFNILTDNANGTRMADEDVFMPTLWEDSSVEGWTQGTLNPNARVMDGYEDDLNWMEHASGIGYRQSYNISASGGTDKTSYFTSMGYTDEEGYFDHTSFSRINARAKVDVTPTTWLKMGVNLSTSFTDSENPYVSGNPWVYSRQIAPIYPVYQHNYTTGKYILDDSGNKKYDDGVLILDDNGDVLVPRRGTHANSNIYHSSSLNQNSTSALSLLGQAYATVTFLKDFKFTADASLNNYYNYNNYYNSPVVGAGVDLDGTARNSAYRALNSTYKQILEWSRSFDKHQVDILVGHETNQQQTHLLSADKNGEIFPGSIELDNFSSIQAVYGTSDLYRSEGYLGRANYNYDEKYYLSASFRRDGSSKFAPQSRWGNFWSIGGSWIVSSEEFMSNVMWVDFLKVRASYGTNGNDGGFVGRNAVTSVGIGYYAWQSNYATDNFLGSPSLIMGNPGFPNLMWETAGALDIGVDFRLFNRLNGTLGYFEKSSDELIFDVPVPISSGVKTEIQNLGSMVNRGVELSLDIDVIRKKDWVWNVGLNMAWMQNRITNLPSNSLEKGIVKDTYKLLKVGESLHTWYLYDYGGVDAQDGMVYYHKDPEAPKSEHDLEIGGKIYTKNTAAAAQVVAGDALSPITGSLSSSLSWKNFTFDVLLAYRIGGDAYDYAYGSLISGNGGAMSPDIYNSWRKPGDNTGWAALGRNGLNSNTLIDNSYISVQNITLSYRFPKKIAKKLTLEGLSVYVSGENLYQISAIDGYDAASTFIGSTDVARFASMATVSFGINVSF